MNQTNEELAMYNLIKPLSIEYELNRGAMPSGYAKIKLIIQAIISPNLNKKVVFEGPIQLGTVHVSDYAKQQSNEGIASLIPDFMQMALAGIEEGCSDALTNFFGSSPVGIKILIESVSFDLEFSTRFAFRVAARISINELLKQAEAENLLILG